MSSMLTKSMLNSEEDEVGVTAAVDKRMKLLAHLAMLTAMTIFGGLNIIAKKALDTGHEDITIFCQ
jgi:hypothetical protein